MLSPEEKNNQLKEITVFSSLSENKIEELGKIVRFEHYPKFSYVYMQGEKSENIYFLIKGMVKLGHYTKDGKEVIKYIYQAPVVFGEKCITGEIRREEFAQVLTDNVLVISLRLSDFLQFLANTPQLNLNIIHLLATRIKQSECRLESLLCKDARTRIVEFLRENVLSAGKKIGMEILLVNPLTQQDIANFTGTSRQTVTLVLNDLKKLNVIHFNRKNILVRDVARLI